MSFDLAKETRSRARPKAGPLTISYVDGREPVSADEPIGYNDYIRSPKWRAFRQRYFSTHKMVCKGCGATKTRERWIELHHRTYVRLGHEKDADLVPLCQVCHTMVHQYHRNRPQMTLAAATSTVVRRQQIYAAKAAKAAKANSSEQKRQKRRVTPLEQQEMKAAIERLNERQHIFVPANQRKTAEQRRNEPISGRAGQLRGLPITTPPVVKASSTKER